MISHQVFERMRPKPEVREAMDIRMAGEGSLMIAKRLSNVQISVDGMMFHHPVYVGPLQDDMLLGVDFIRGAVSEISVRSGTMTIGDRPIPMFTVKPLSVSGCCSLETSNHPGRRGWHRRMHITDRNAEFYSRACGKLTRWSSHRTEL